MSSEGSEPKASAMHISRVQLVNFRNFERVDAVFNKGVNTVIGENGSGKTNLFRAIRLLLDADQLRWAYRLDETDFHRGLKNWRGHWIVISLEFSEVSQDEAIQALFLHGTGAIEDGAVGRATYNLIFRPSAAVRAKLGALEEGDQASLAELLKGLTTDDYETVLTGKSTADFTDPDVYKELVGDFDEVRFPEELNPPEIGGPIPRALSISKEICFTFIQALRDVVSEFQGQRTNPLLTLLRRKIGEIDPVTLEPITEKVKDLNAAIEGLPDVGEIRSDIRQTIRDAAGETYSPANLAVRSAVPAEAERLFQSLRLFVGETEDDYEGAIHELSLGGANLIYLTLKLLEFKYQKAKEACANFLLIEEPEAHIHTHIQKTLFDRLTYTDTQVIYSTHSTHVSEVSNVENVNILARNGPRCEVYQPAAGLDAGNIRSIQRYLDAVRSNLLFAKSVILVEGDAEEILVPALVRKVLGVSLDELGISLINVRSTGFENVAVLFHDDRIRKRCAIVTDLDACFFDTNPDPADSDAVAKQKLRALGSAAAGVERQTRLNAFRAGNAWVSTHYAPCTFEVEFVRSGNVEVAVDSIGAIYVDPPTIQQATEDLRSTDPACFGQRILTMAGNHGKGWFAIQLAKRVTAKSHIPPYILEAIFTDHRPLSRTVVANMIDYRLKTHDDPALLPLNVASEIRAHAAQYQRGEIETAALVGVVAPALPTDVIIKVLGYA